MQPITPSMTVIKLISHGQELQGVTDQQLGLAMGSEESKADRTVMLMKTGSIKFPINKVVPVSSILSIEPATLLRTVLREYMPDVLCAVDALFVPAALTFNEHKLLDAYRYLSKGNDVTPTVIEGTSIIALVTI